MPSFLKLLPYIIIVGLIAAICFGFVHLTNQIEDLTNKNTVLEAQNAEVNNNYTALQNMYSISMKQVEELQKQQKESLAYVDSVKQAMSGVDLSKAYDEDSVKLLNKINEYEKCMAKYFKDPYHHCYEETEK